MQQRGPPTSPMAPSDFAVILCDSANGSTLRGVEPEMIDTNMPEEIPAPQAPQKPHAPPGTFFPRFIISERAFSRSISPPAFRYAVRSAAPTMTWCSGPCMWQNGSAIIFSRIRTGSFDVSLRHRPTIASIPAV